MKFTISITFKFTLFLSVLSTYVKTTLEDYNMLQFIQKYITPQNIFEKQFFNALFNTYEL